MAAATCPSCGAYTSTVTGYCQVCRSPLHGVTPQPAQAPAYPQPQQQYPAPGYGQPAYGTPAGYGQPNPYYGQPAYGVPMGYGYPMMPVVYVPATYVDPAVHLAKQTGGARWAAAVIDILIVFGVWLMLFVFVYPAVFGAPFGFFSAGRFLITVMWVYLYYGVLDGMTSGTLGKRALGLALVDRQLKPISPGKGFARSLEIFIWGIGGGLLLLIIQVVIIGDKGQGIGDKIGGTFLVRKAQLAQVRPAA